LCSYLSAKASSDRLCPGLDDRFRPTAKTDRTSDEASGSVSPSNWQKISFLRQNSVRDTQMALALRLDAVGFTITLRTRKMPGSNAPEKYKDQTTL
jgi:hypothetical protein